VTTIRGTYGQVALYRHCDGYLAEAGAALAEALKGTTHPETAAARLLAPEYEATSFRPAAPVYRFTTAADDHGDLDHTYEAAYRNGAWTVLHAARNSFSEGEGWHPVATYTLAEFAVAVNRDRAETNKRIETRNKEKAPEAQYGTYPPLTGF
jgi:hypothetical protein